MCIVVVVVVVVAINGNTQKNRPILGWWKVSSAVEKETGGRGVNCGGY